MRGLLGGRGNNTKKAPGTLGDLVGPGLRGWGATEIHK